jgi:hypothetical protein
MATSRSTLLRVTAWVLRVGAVLTLLDLVVSAVVYRSDLDYRFEVIALLIAWLVLVATGVLVAVSLRRELRTGRLLGAEQITVASGPTEGSPRPG